MLNLAVSGYCGRVGNRIAMLAVEDEEIKLVGGLEAKDHIELGKDIGCLIGKEEEGIILTDSTETAIRDADVLIEFTTPEATISNLIVCQEKKVNMVIGTTGLSQEQFNKIGEASKEIAIVQSSNMSIGVNLLFELVKIVAEKIYNEADIEILEAHHRFKKDAPSGTAKTIAEIISRIKNKDLKEIAVYGRDGDTGFRSREEVGIHALRASDIVGEHNVVFGLDGERLELIHKAHTRDIFVLGALRAAKFVGQKDSGLYSMKDVLNKKF